MFNALDVSGVPSSGPCGFVGRSRKVQRSINLPASQPSYRRAVRPTTPHDSMGWPFK